jgi:polysaccharide export outer membrane protein
VTVGIAEYHSRPISVAGAVKAPLTFQAAGPVTLLEAITRAGGLTAEAGPDIVVSRQGSDKSGTPLQRIPVKGLFDIADPMLNLSLTGGEEIRVPEIGKVFVVGNVKKPGAYPLQSGSETSILKVIALAEGLLPFAAKEAYVYRREGGNGGKNEIPVELKKILDRKIPDTALLANDVLYVPDNNTKRLGTAALERLLMFGSTAGATALIYGQAR